MITSQSSERGKPEELSLPQLRTIDEPRKQKQAKKKKEKQSSTIIDSSPYATWQKEGNAGQTRLEDMSKDELIKLVKNQI